MATSAHRCIENTIWKIEGITPTDLRTSRRKFRHNPRPVKDDPEKAAGTIRSFTLRWMGAGPPDTPTDGYDRISDHNVELDFVYPSDMPMDDLAKIMQVDSHDLILTLRHPDSWVGYSDANPSTDIGLCFRFHQNTRVSYGPVVTHMIQDWVLNIRETEYNG